VGFILKLLGHVGFSDLVTSVKQHMVSWLFRRTEAHCMRVYSFNLSFNCSSPETQTLRSLVFFVRGIAIATALALPSSIKL